MRISVAGVAVKEGKVLIALRKPGTSIGEKWEFPGGKLENGESPEKALEREYCEELSVPIKVGEKLCEGAFRNGPKKYRLLVYKIELVNENFKTPEHQKIKWVGIPGLRSFEFPVSDTLIVDYLLSR